MTAATEQNLRFTDWPTLLREWGPRLLLFARQQAPSPADAEDIVQEAFVRFWRARERGEADDPRLLFPLIRRIAIDHARQGRRRARRAARLAAETETAWFEPPGENGDRAELLERSLRNLPTEQREVVVLKVWGELTFEAIGEVLGISPHTAASRYRYALNHLRRTLSPVLS
jgi:RNA polymerase sigma-70 factor (ECF subfamily)